MLVPSVEQSLWALPLTVLAASVVGSPHCIAMCGPLALNFASSRARLIAYQLGRASSYMLAGALAGSLGQTALSRVQSPYISAFSLLLIALVLILTGVRALRGQPSHFSPPRWLAGPLAKLNLSVWAAIRISRGYSEKLSAFLAGSFTVFLPCGHLYGFLLGAMATGSALGGAIFMTAFWLGTVPALGFGAGWLRSLMKPGMRNGPRWAGALLIAGGLLSLFAFASRLERPAQHSHPLRASELRCH